MINTAIVSGGAHRIGRQIALTLARMNFNIALTYHHSQQEAEETKIEIETKIGGRCELFKADLRIISAIPSLLETILEKLPAPSLLVNNASTFNRRKFGKITEEEFDQDWNINFKAPFFLTQSFVQAVPKGHIINILDAYISKNETNHFDYLLAKKALLNFTEMTAYALSPNFRVNALSLSPLLPPKHEILDIAEFSNLQPLMGALAFLVENPLINGQNIFVDGGIHL